MKNEDYWNKQPCNIRHSDAPIGTVRYFNEVRHKKYLVEPHIVSFADFKAWKNKEVLEIGCGIGTDMVEFILNGAFYCGIDSSATSIAIAKKRLEAYFLKGELYCIRAEELIAEDEGESNGSREFDLIYSFGVLHHIPHPETVLEDIKSLCHDKTVIKLMLYSRYSWKHFRIFLGLDQHEAQANVPIVRTYSFREIRKLMKDYEITSIRKAHIFKYKLEPYKRHQYEVLWYWKWMPTRLFSWFERRLGWHTLIEAKLKV